MGSARVDEVLQGYRATGQFNPERWFLVRHQGEEIGCLILTDYPEHATWELIYMGVLPAARGRGWGAGDCAPCPVACRPGRREVASCWPWTRPMQPALRMYAAAGFREWDRTSVYIRILDEKAH